MNKAYWNARSYAFKLDPVNYKDICHDAYLSYFKSKQTNLFLEHPGTITQVIKYTTFDSWKKKSHQSRDERLQGVRQHIEFKDGGDEFVAHKANSVTPFDEFIANELLERYNTLVLTAGLSRARGKVNIIKDILELRLVGFNNKEIADKLGVAKSLVTYYINRSNLETLTI